MPLQELIHIRLIHPGKAARRQRRQHVRMGPPARLSAKWEGMAWPSARAHSHVLSALPAGSFPGVDESDVYEFLERHDQA